ncbi:ATP-binding protein [Aeromicrobium sp.]|uniref:sensor histidine kinase n=1 Tax=Aeromicrobium sp. TaxID=1871063 RepID=UPI0025C413D4|nr:ATP-binding protein [Aeromicrobium sp.]MCK5890462.1 ATP-binding protein [Aeromicrobium sp.]
MSDRLDRPLRWVLVRHLGGLAVILLVVGVLAVALADRIATREAARHAERDTRTLAAEYVVPLTISDLHEGGDELRRELDATFAARIGRDEIRGVTIWESVGGSRARAVYSVRNELRGSTFDLGRSAELFGTEEAIAHRVGPGDYPGDPYPEGTFEAYVGFRDGTGASYVFEAYLPTPAMAPSRAELLTSWLPLVLGSLVVLGLTTAGLSARLARRVATVEAERRELIGSALRAGELERRRLAQRLHDGVLQDLSGAGLALDSVGAGLDEPRRAVLDQVAGLLRRDVGQLRSIGDDLFPVEADADLGSVVREAASEVPRGNVDVEVDIGHTELLDERRAAAVRDVVREAVRNAVRHANAGTVRVVTRDADGVCVVVQDDGVGFARREAEPGHLGLRLMEHVADSVGATLEVETGPGAGTTVTLTLPRR